jgi:cobalt-zinc-cadmium efflux system outer membrane protein
MRSRLAPVWVALLLLPVTAGPAPGQEAVAAPDSTLGPWLERAVADHPELKAAHARWEAAVHRVAVEGGWPDPVVSWTWYVEAVETAVGPQEHRFALTQRIPWFGTLGAQSDAAASEARAAEAHMLAVRLTLQERVARAWYDYAYLARAEAITRENLELLRYEEGVARARYRTDNAGYPAVIRAQVEMGQLDDRLRALRDRRGPTAAALNEALGRALDAPLPWPASLEGPEIEVPDSTAVLAAVRSANPDLIALDHEVEAARHRVDAAGKQGGPDFGLGVATILTGDSDLTNFPGQGKDPWMLTVSMSLPLWRGKYSGAVDAAEATGRALEHQREDQARRLEVAAREALFRLSDAERRIALYKEGLLPKADQSVRASATAFQNGRVGFLDFLDAQRTRLEFQLQLAAARADFGRAVVGIARLMGHAPAEGGQ